MDRDSKNRARRERYAARSTDQHQASLLGRRLVRSAKRKALLAAEQVLSDDLVSCSVSVGPGPLPASTEQHVDIRVASSRAEEHSHGPVSAAQKRRRNMRLIDDLPLDPWVLPDVAPCVYCNALRFYREPPGFCCGEGQVSLAPREMLPGLTDLLIGESEISVEFRRHIRSYNNHLAFTSIGMKADKNYCWSNKGVYTLVVQGMVYHYIRSLKEDAPAGSNLDLYFHEFDGLVRTRGQRSFHLNPDLVASLVHMLRNNPYCRFFRSLRHYTPLVNYTIVLRSTPALDQHTFNLPSVSQVGAIWKEADPSNDTITRDIRVYVNEDTSHTIKYYYGCYDLLQYPLLFPRGEAGWHSRISKHRKHTQHPVVDTGHRAFGESASLISPNLAESADVLLQNEADVLEDGSERGSDVSLRQYYCYLFQLRPRDKSYLLHFGRLCQQFVIDMYIKLETQRLDYYRSEQLQLDMRTDTYQSVVDSMSVDGQNNPNAVGRRFVLPSSFIGGPRDMRRRYVNAMALVQKFGKPDIFLTMTCNPAWPEIADSLLKHERAEDRPDLLARVFKAKLEELKNDIVRKKVFGPVAAYVYVVEFQKRGLPHVHWLVILKPSHKILTPDMYDSIISAELPSASSHPFLRSYVIKHMLHGPCGDLNPTNVCMRDGNCKNHYPKKFVATTHIGSNSYPMYRRRENGDFVVVRKSRLDNRWVVPYNPYLLAKYNCHINVEICCDIKLVKYLYKYIYKGHDRVAYNIIGDSDAQADDEIRNFQTGRWVAAPEAHWRIYGFALSDMHPPVIVLQVHLENQHVIRFGRQAPLLDIIPNPLSQRTMLTEFFRTNALDRKAQQLNLLYREFPEHYVWNNYARSWSVRSKKEVVGRLVTVNPCEGERFFKRILLNNIRCPPSAQFLRTVNGLEYPTFREAAMHLGLLESDSYISDCLEEASLHHMAPSLRRLFATILVYCAPSDPVRLWHSFHLQLSQDFSKQPQVSDVVAQQKALESIHCILQSMGKSINDYSLSEQSVRLTEEQKFCTEIAREKSIIVSPQDLISASMLNACQREAFDLIISALDGDVGGAFFVDGPGGSGKTFLYRSILAYVRSHDHIALSVATSGVAASLLPGGRTAHSRFKFPLEFDDNADSKLSKQSSLGRLIKVAKLIVWDEATMANKCVVEALDTLLRDVCDSDLLFGGKVVLFGGDFRQTLPIIVGGSRDDMVGASLVSSFLWPSIRKLRLHVNMRARDDPMFIDLLLSIGDGTHPCVIDDIIQLPSHLCIPFVNPADSLGQLINCVFPSFYSDTADPFSVVSRAILTPKNDIVDDINAQLIEKFPGLPVEYMSFNKTDDPGQQSEYGDYLNSVSVSGLPPHHLVLKLNCPVMLLRNLDPSEGMCNGTRLIVRHLGPRLIAAEIAIGDYKGRHVFIPRIPLQASDKIKCPIPFKRHQFPLRLCFAMTINKAQGQTLDYVGVYLQEHVFSHGQLYVAISRARPSSNVKTLVRPISHNDVALPLHSTKNVVYPEIFKLSSC